MPSLHEIHKSSELINYLEVKGRNHECYYHYTTWDSLTKIFSNKTFLLTRGNASNINDQHEALMKGSYDEWNKVYIGSFSFGSSENMAMWGLYGLPWMDAVRLAIPKKEMNQWIKSIENICLFDDDGKHAYHNGYKIGLNDIIYASGKSKKNLFLSHYGKHVTIRPLDELYEVNRNPLMTGYIKNYAWQYENEVRLRIRLNCDTGYEKICVSIPEDVLDAISITTGPYFRYKEDGLYRRLWDEGRIEESGFLGLVKYRDLCGLCQHERFLKKSGL